MTGRILLAPTILLRIASVLTFIHCIGHTRSVLRGPLHGAEEIAVIDTMKSHSFDFSGFQRNYWDFHLGFAWFLTVILIFQVPLFWYLSSVVKSSSVSVRPILALFSINFLAMAIVSWKYFTFGPIVIELLIAACLIAAFATASPVEVRLKPHRS